MPEKKRILYVQTSGVDTPMRLYSPVVLATVAKSMNIEPIVYFLGKGLTVIKKGVFFMDIMGVTVIFLYTYSVKINCYVRVYAQLTVMLQMALL